MIHPSFTLIMPIVTTEQRDYLLQQAEQAAQHEARYESRVGDFLVPGSASRGVQVPTCMKRASWVKEARADSPTSTLESSSSQDQAHKVNPVTTIQTSTSYNVATLAEAPRRAPETRRPGTLRGHSFDEDHLQDGVVTRGGKKPIAAAAVDTEPIFTAPIPHENEEERPHYATRPGVVRGKSMDEDEMRDSPKSRRSKSLAIANPTKQAEIAAAMQAVEIASFSSEEEIDEHKLVAKVNPHPTSIRIKHYNPAEVPFMPEAPPVPEPTRRPETLRGNSFDESSEHGQCHKRGGKKPTETKATAATKMHRSAPNLDYRHDRDEAPVTAADIRRASLLSNRYQAKLDDFVNPGQAVRAIPKMQKRESWVKPAITDHHAKAGTLSPRKPLW